jgi:hypothetical protein
MSYGFIRLQGENFPIKKEKRETLADELDYCPKAVIEQANPFEYEYKIIIYFAHRNKNPLEFHQGYIYREAQRKYKQLVRTAKFNRTENITVKFWSNDFMVDKYEC